MSLYKVAGCLPLLCAAKITLHLVHITNKALNRFYYLQIIHLKLGLQIWIMQNMYMFDLTKRMVWIARPKKAFGKILHVFENAKTHFWSIFGSNRFPCYLWCSSNQWPFIYLWLLLGYTLGMKAKLSNYNT